jgi:hypothetical protein
MENIEYCHKVLGLEPGAPEAAIKEAYHDLIMVWRPDRYEQDPRLQKKAIDKLKEIDEAYRALTSQTKREAEKPAQHKVENHQSSTPSPKKAPRVEEKTPSQIQPELVYIPRISGRDITASRNDSKYEDTARDKRVGGWLLTLCVFMTIIWPLGGVGEGRLLLREADNLITTSIAWIAIIGSFFGLYAGILLWRVKEGAVAIARIFFIGLMVWHSVFFFMGAVIPGIIGVLFCFTIYLYLTSSKRVQLTYGTSVNRDNTDRNKSKNIRSNDAEQILARQQLRSAFDSANKDLSATERNNKAEGKPNDQVSGVTSPNVSDTHQPGCVADSDQINSRKSVPDKNHTEEVSNNIQSNTDTPNKTKIMTSADPISGMPSVEKNNNSAVPLFFRVLGFLVLSIVGSFIVLALGMWIFESNNTSASNQKKMTSVPPGNTAAVNSNARQDTGTTVVQSSDHPQDPKSLTSVNSSMETTKSGQPSTSNITDIYAYARYGLSDGVAIEIPRNWVIWDQKTILQIANQITYGEKVFASKAGTLINQPNNVLLAAGTDLMEKSPVAQIWINMRLGNYPSQEEISKASIEIATYRSEMLKDAQNMTDQIKAESRGQIRNIRVIDARYEKIGKYTSFVLEGEYDFVNNGLHANRIDYIYMSDRVYKINTAYKISEEHTYKNIMQHVRQSFSDSRR